MSRAIAIAIATLALAGVGGLRAQGDETQSAPPTASARIVQAQRELQQNRAEIEHLIELRIHHDLGLPTDGDEQAFRQPMTVGSVALTEMQRQLREEDAETRSLRERFEKLRDAADRRQQEDAERARQLARERSFVAIPAAGSALVPDEPRRAAPRPAAAPAGESAAPRTAGPIVGDITLDPLRAQIQGSSDHQRVAQALFKAGQALMDRAAVAREQARDELAREFDDRARDRLQRAVTELQPLLQQPEPDYVALFYLGRCRELLFRYSERYEDLSLSISPREFQRREQEVREPFLAISARDVQKTGERGAVEVLGEWGQAAQTAMEHFRWMNQRGGYDASAVIDALTWPGEQGR